MTSQCCQDIEEREKEREEDKDKDKDSFFTEREEAISDLGAGATDLTDFSSYFESVDSIAIRKERCEAIGGGAVQLSDEQMQELFSKLSLTDFEYYVGVIRKCIDKGHTYRRKSHCQAILDMAKKDGKLINSCGSFNTDEFFRAALEKVYK